MSVKLRPIPLLLRKITLRSTLASALFCITFSILSLAQSATATEKRYRIFVIYCLPPFVVILHHTSRIWQRKYWLTFFELIYSTIELAGLGVMVLYMAPPDSAFIGSAQPSINFTLLFGSSLALATACAVAFFCLLREIYYYPATGVSLPYDFFAGYPTCSSRRWSLVFGAHTLRRRFSTDHVLLRWIRGGTAVLCLLAMILLALLAVVGQPIQQGKASSAVKEFRMPRDSFGGVGSLLAVLDVGQVQGFFGNLSPGVTFGVQTVTWTVDDTQPSNADCEFLAMGSQEVSGVFVANCHLEPENRQDDTLKKPPSRVAIYLGASDSYKDITANSRPIHLVPGVHVYGIGEYSVKEKFISSSVAAIGIPQYRRFTVVDVHSLIPGGRLQGNNKTAVLHLSLISGTPQLLQDIRVEQDYSERSVLSGFALLGGVWTILNGMFAASFGTTLLLVLFGIKPLSIYGIIHFFQRRRSAFVDRGHILSAEELNQTVGILREHLLDADDVDANQIPKTQALSCDMLDSPRGHEGGASSEGLLEGAA